MIPDFISIYSQLLCILRYKEASQFHTVYTLVGLNNKRSFMKSFLVNKQILTSLFAVFSILLESNILLLNLKMNGNNYLIYETTKKAPIKQERKKYTFSIMMTIEKTSFCSPTCSTSRTKDAEQMNFATSILHNILV